jgi:peptidoglycan biosynthesis protein MviN/MurJ (putative lipid II flippase)
MNADAMWDAFRVIAILAFIALVSGLAWAIVSIYTSVKKTEKNVQRLYDWALSDNDMTETIESAKGGK